MSYNYILITIFIIFVFILCMFLISLFLYQRIAKWGNEVEQRAESSSEERGKTNEYREEMFGRDEIGELVRSFHSMEDALGRQMKNIAFMTAEREKAQAELSVATRIQKDMLPSDFSAIRKAGLCDIYGSMTPAKEVGGDFYDFFALDEERLCLVIADVSGKGVPAALFMTIAKTLIKQRATSAAGTPGQILADVNNQLCADNKEMLFVTVWLGILNTKTGEMDYCNAGHEYPVLLHEGKGTLLKDGANEPPLALAEGYQYKDKKAQLQKNDGLFVYTDGIPEAKNAAKDRYGMERMVETLEGFDQNGSCQIAIESMRADMASFVNGTEPFDDLTMLMVRLIENKA